MIVFPVLAAIITFIVTGLVRSYALKRDLLDHPNHRSLHTSPTPRGGGIGIVVSVLVYVLYALGVGDIDRAFAIAIAGGGGLVALIGWIDDVRSLSRRSRLVAQFAAAIWAVSWLGGLPSIGIGVGRVPLGIAGAVAAVVLVVWITNLYNFMDGTDGLAAVEAVFVAGGGGLLLFERGATSFAACSFVVCGAALGFLYWNWSPARIFMGDVGSSFLGFIFGVLAIVGETARALPLLVWFILGAVFFMDASITILRRVRGGLWLHAHRSHAYQRLVRSGLSHAALALSVSGVDAILLGVGALAIARPDMLLTAALTAVAITAVLYSIVERMHPFVLESPPATNS